MVDQTIIFNNCIILTIYPLKFGLITDDTIDKLDEDRLRYGELIEVM